MREQLLGQGIWIWQLPQSSGGDPERIAEECVRQGLRHVLLKGVDGAHRYRTSAGRDAVVVERLRAAGVQVAGWGFHYGREPEAEARAALALCGELRHSVYIFNAERAFEVPEGAERARRFIRTFREEGGAEIALGLSTFALPELHPAFPYRACLNGTAGCDFALPQIYPVHSKRRPYLRRAITYLETARNELARFGKPVVPTLRAYAGDGMADWAAIAADAREFLSAPAEARGPAWNWWVWQAAEKDAGMWEALGEAQN